MTRVLPLIMLTFTMAFGCGGGGGSTDKPDLTQVVTNQDLLGVTPSLEVDNTISWCKVTVTVGTDAAVTFDDSSHKFTGAPGTTVTLHADPHATFKPVKWTGAKTTNGADATYVITTAATQTVVACCALPDGSGC